MTKLKRHRCIYSLDGGCSGFGSVEVPFCKRHLWRLGNPKTLEELCAAVYNPGEYTKASLFAHYRVHSYEGNPQMSAYKVVAGKAWRKKNGLEPL